MGTSEERDRIRSRLEAIARGGEVSTVEDVDMADASPTPEWLTEPESKRGAWWAPARLRAARLDPGRRGAVALAVVGVLAAAFGGLSVLRDKPVAQAVPPLPAVHAQVTGKRTPAASVTTEHAHPEPSEEVVVSVVGEVGKPGLVRLSPGSRVADAVAAAGGAKEGANLLTLNMARRVADGDQIAVGVTGAPPEANSPAVGAGSGGQAAKPSLGSKVSLNSATEQELDALPGVGPVTAAAIVAWRNSNGKFSDVEQLGDVDGIGPGRLAKLRELVTV